MGHSVDEHVRAGIVATPTVNDRSSMEHDNPHRGPGGATRCRVASPADSTLRVRRLSFCAVVIWERQSDDATTASPVPED